MNLFGRRILYTPYEKLDESNIREEFKRIYPIFLENKSEIVYLFNYYKGNQPILYREKKVRPEINNRIVENHANEITTFKTGYLLNKPIQYVARKDKVDNESVEKLNDYLLVENKSGKDKLLANHQSICGTAYRLILPNDNYKDDGNESPFNIYDVDPRQGFVIRSTRLGNKPVFGGFCYITNDKSGTHWVMEGYTDTHFYRFEKEILTKKEHHLGYIPFVEYPLNEERIGDFEKVIPMLDAINTVQSNRVDGVEQFIQALMIFKNVDIVKEDFEALKDMGAIKIKDNGTGEKKVEANVEYLTKEINQSQTQSLIDYMYKIVLTICGMPNRNGGTSTSDTGNAVIMRDGWSDAEARASDTESMFRTSELESLRLMLVISKKVTKDKMKLSVSDLDIKFTRRNYENVYQKAQVLDLLLKNPKVDPRYAFVVCGLFSDPETAYNESAASYEEVKKELLKQQGGNDNENNDK